jgi:hypothetical protein
MASGSSYSAGASQLDLRGSVRSAASGSLKAREIGRQRSSGACAKGHSGSSPQTERRRTEEARQSERRMPRWVWVGENELDYLAADVTMRFFTPASPERRGQRGESHIEYFGEDVTVRYFAPRDATRMHLHCRRCQQEAHRRRTLTEASRAEYAKLQ